MSKYTYKPQYGVIYERLLKEGLTLKVVNV